MDKQALQGKTVDQLLRLAKKYGAKTETADGKRKKKEQLVNSVLMAYRLKGGKGLADGGKKKSASGGKYAFTYGFSTNKGSVIYQPKNGRISWIVGTETQITKFVDDLKGNGFTRVPIRDIKL